MNSNWNSLGLNLCFNYQDRVKQRIHHSSPTAAEKKKVKKEDN